MRVKLAETAGFCMGVRRALELALGSLRRYPQPIYTYGPLIHNPKVLQMLEENGISELTHIPEHINGGTVIIRAHGVPQEIKEKLKAAGFDRVVDGTCARVIRVQAIISRAARQGAQVVIVGDAEHPEVVGLLAHAAGQGAVLESLEQLSALPAYDGKVVVVAQTTQNQEFYDEACARLKSRYCQVEIFQTICQATKQRQSEVMKLAREVDAIVVVGGRQSANSLRLFNLAQANGGRAYLAEDESDIDGEALASLSSIGITAGASTPNWLIKRVTRHIKDMPGSGRNQISNFLLKTLRFIARCQVFTGFSAAALCLAAQAMQAIKPDWRMPLVAFCFVMAMQLINNLLESKADQYNDPEQTLFMAAHARVLMSLGVLSCGLALALAALWGGAVCFALLATMTVLGILYSIPVMPARLKARFNIKRLRDIPGSKTVALMLAWGTVSAVLPAYAATYTITPLSVLAAFYVMGLIFIKTSMVDLVSIQGDLFVGKETLPIVLGERKTRRILKAVYGLLAFVLLVAGIAGLLAWPLLMFFYLPLAGLAFMQQRFFNRPIFPELSAQSLLEVCLWPGALALLLWY